jgi:hypothetical protein
MIAFPQSVVQNARNGGKFLERQKGAVVGKKQKRLGGSAVRLLTARRGCTHSSAG